MSEAALLEKVQEVRRSVRVMPLVAADRIPDTPISPAGFSASAWHEMREAAMVARHAPLGDPLLIAAVQRGLSLLPAPGNASALERLRSCVDDADPHDAYFRVARTDCIASVGYLRGLLRAMLAHLSEAELPEELHAYRTVPLALIGLWGDALELPDEGWMAAQGEAVERPTMRHLAPDPVRRWVRGHQVFAALTQGLIWSFHQLGRAVQAEDGDAIERSLARLKLMFDASAAGFRFASDFDPSHYADTIRPSMSEPHVAKGFSGTLSSDHGRLVSVMVLMRPVLAQVQAQHPIAYAGMTEALAAVYEDHKFVCGRFDGGTKASLRGEGRASAHSGVEMLDRFKTQRMKIVS